MAGESLRRSTDQVYLLDTNVVSELRRVRPHEAVLDWLRGIDNNALRISAVTIGEVQAGIEILRDRDPSKGAEIESWLEEICVTFNVIVMDAESFRRWARLMHGRSAALMEDAMIAATAQTHGLTVVTRNTRDFEIFAVPAFDPFAARR